MVCQSVVVHEIKSILDHEFIDCGYRLMTYYLKQARYHINHKKRAIGLERSGLALIGEWIAFN